MPELMTLDELSKRLRFSRRTLYKMLDAGKIPALKIGNKWRFDEAAIDDWIKKKSRVGKLRLLVIDDEPDIGILFKNIFESDGHEIATAVNGPEGIRKLADSVPDLVFLDLLMPDMNGAQALEQIRAINPELPVVMITGYPDSAVMERVLEHGPITVLKKPLSIESLRSVVENFMKAKA